MKVSYTTLFLAIILVMISACYHNADLSIAPPKPAPPGSEFKCSHDTIYFQNSVMPVILNGCAKTGCHDEASHKADHVLDNYAGIYSLVTPFDPPSSKLYIVLFSNSEGRMPPTLLFLLTRKVSSTGGLHREPTITNVIPQVVIRSM